MQYAGLYNETAFRGLDFVLDQASQYGVKVMFTLTNNWKTFDSKYNVRLLPPPNACPRGICSGRTQGLQILLNYPSQLP